MPGFFFELFESADTFFEEFVESLTLFFVSVPFIFEVFEGEREIFVFLGLDFVVPFDFAVGSHEGIDFGLPVIAHPLQSGVLSDRIIDLDAHLMNLHFQIIDIIPQLSQVLL